MISRAVAVMAKAPLPGVAKTRLSPVVGSIRAAALHRAFLLDTLATVGKAPGCDVFVVCPSTEQGRVLESLVPSGVRVLVQEGIGLMAGLSYAQSALLKSYRSVVLMDADSPTLPAERILEAFQALDETADLVLGPCEDGGYYLIGVCRPWPELFSEGYQASDTCERTARRAAGLGLTVARLAPWYDIDEPADLARLIAEVWAHPERARHVYAEIAPGWTGSLLQGRIQ